MNHVSQAYRRAVAMWLQHPALVVVDIALVAVLLLWMFK